MIRKREQKPPFSLDRNDWDFRKVTDKQLGYAIIYEYARSCDWVRETIEKWHERRLPSWEHSDLREWSGLKVEEALRKEITLQSGLEKGEVFSMPWPVSDAMVKGREEVAKIPHIEVIEAMNRLFPTPFLKSPPPNIEVLQLFHPLGSKRTPFQVYEKFPMSAKRAAIFVIG